MIKRNVEDIYKGLDFWAQGEYCMGVMFIHCDVYTPTSSTIKKARKMFKEVREAVNQHGYDSPIFTYTQNPRFCKLMGGVYHNTFQFEGKTYEVWKWE